MPIRPIPTEWLNDAAAIVPCWLVKQFGANAEDAQDATQESMWEVEKRHSCHLINFESEKLYLSYVRTAAKNRWLSMCRKTRESPLPDSYDVSSSVDLPSADVERREFLANYELCRMLLTEFERKVFDRRLNDETLKSIASDLECPLSRVFLAQSRARQKLRDCLDRCMPVCKEDRVADDV